MVALKLRGRFTLWFCLAALIPILTAALITRSILTKSLVEEETRTQESGDQEMQALLAGLEASVVVPVERLARKQDPYVGGTLLHLTRGGGHLDEYSKQLLKENGGPLMAQLSLDLLLLLNQDSIVIDAPHFQPSIGDVRTKGKQSGVPSAFYRMEKIIVGGRVKEVPMIEAQRSLSGQDQEVTVVVGRRLVASMFGTMHGRGNVQIRVLSVQGKELVSPAAAWREVGTLSSYVLKNREGKKLALVEMRIGTDALPALLEKISLSSLALALAALALTFLLGTIVARRMTRDLDRLLVGVDAAARGDLEHQVEIQRSDEIGALGFAFNTMMNDLHDSKERLVMAERVAAWQEIARRLAHEIKNPLTPIQMSMETLRKTYQKKHPSFDEVFEESTLTVLEEASRLKRIVAEFSEFARMPKPKTISLQVNEIVRSQVSLYQGSVEIVASLLPGLALIEADKDLLSQLLLNLFENARDAIAGQEDGRIEVSTVRGQNGRTVVIYIDDNGPGVSSDIAAKLFTPYFTTKHAEGGTGLGLAIAHRIVLDHGGRLAVEKSPIGGARFRIELPMQADLSL